MPIEQIKHIVDYGIIGFLLFLSFLTFAFAIERVLYFRSVKLEEYSHEKQLELDLGKHLSTIASIGVNAPYIGLLGTVIAIILTFYIIGENQADINPGEIMKHLALALKATAAGLVVLHSGYSNLQCANDKVDKLLSQWEILRDEGQAERMRRERFDKMNVVPFIDIVLVLLVIVLATATFVQNKAIKIDLPSASSKKSEEKKSIVISIDKEGKYFYDKEELSFEVLQAKLETLDPKKDLVSLHTDKLTPFDYFVKVIDVMKAKGFENISIVTKQ